MFTLALALLATSSVSFSQAIAAPKVGLVFDKGGKDDKSFNASAWRGLQQARDELKLEIKAVEAADDNAFETLLRAFAQKDFDLIIGVGIAQAQAVKKIAGQFPAKKFAIIDAEVQLPNVRSILFEEHEGSYLAGALAAMASKSGKIGFIGGMDVPLIRRFQMGYEAGARKVSPHIKVTSNYVGVSTEAWNNPAKGKELALSQYDAGADVVFSAAGASGMGMFDAAEERKKLAVGVDSNQNWVKPGRVLTSMLKRVDQGVLMACRDLVAGKFSAGSVRYGLKNGGIDVAMDEFNRNIVTQEMASRIAALKREIIAGKIQVPDYYKKQ